MALLQWALTCRDVSVDSSTNNITYRDAVEQLKVHQFPANLPPLFLVAVLWRRDNINVQESTQYRIAVEDENDGRLIETEPQEVDLENYERMRSAIPSPALEIHNPTTLWFVIEENENDEWQEAGRLPVEIKEATKERVEEVASEPVAE